MSIYNVSKIATKIGITEKKDYARLLLFMDGYQGALTKEELTKLKNTIKKENDMLQSAIKSATPRTKRPTTQPQ